MNEDVGALLAAASATTDASVRATLVAEARQRLVREAQRLRELGGLVEAFERELAASG